LFFQNRKAIERNRQVHALKHSTPGTGERVQQDRRALEGKNKKKEPANTPLKTENAWTGNVRG